jgi:hypothetical protein
MHIIVHEGKGYHLCIISVDITDNNTKGSAC